MDIQESHDLHEFAFSWNEKASCNEWRWSPLTNFTTNMCTLSVPLMVQMGEGAMRPFQWGLRPNSLEKKVESLEKGFELGFDRRT